MYTTMCPAMHNRGGAPLEVNADVQQANARERAWRGRSLPTGQREGTQALGRLDGGGAVVIL
jgi:hypothetical protein